VRAVYLVKERVPEVAGYPFSLPAVRSLLHELKLHAKVTFFIGENGSGKSTLLEAIAVAAGFNAEGGSRNFRFATRSSESELHACIRLVRGVHRPRDGFFLRAESNFNVATEIERLDAEPGAGPPILPAFGGRSTSNRTVNPSSPCCRLASVATASTSWTSPRPPSHPAGSSHSWPGSISSFVSARSSSSLRIPRS
jgi:predicted ATPase